MLLPHAPACATSPTCLATSAHSCHSDGTLSGIDLMPCGTWLRPSLSGMPLLVGARWGSCGHGPASAPGSGKPPAAAALSRADGTSCAPAPPATGASGWCPAHPGMPACCSRSWYSSAMKRCAITSSVARRGTALMARSVGVGDGTASRSAAVPSLPLP